MTAGTPAPARTIAVLRSPAPRGVGPDTDADEARRIVAADEEGGPAPLAVALHGALDLPGVSPIQGTTPVVGRFEVRRGVARAVVLVLWMCAPSVGNTTWVVSVRPVDRRLRRGRRAADQALAVDLAPSVHDVLVSLPDVADLRWLTDAEAEATYPNAS